MDLPEFSKTHRSRWTSWLGELLHGADKDTAHAPAAVEREFRSALDAFSAIEGVFAVAMMAAAAALPTTAAGVMDWWKAYDPINILHIHDLLATPAAVITSRLPTRLMQFRMLWCLWVAISLLRFHPAQARFYKWFITSGISPAKVRGFGYTGCRAFGIFEMPALTVPQFHICNIVMAVCLVFAACPLNNFVVTQSCLFAALVLYFLYFSQLFCESRAAGHGTIIVPLVLIHLLCADDDSAVWPIFLLKAHTAACYFSAGYGKVVVGIFYRKFWADGCSQQYMFWEAMWSRPGGKCSSKVQEFVFRRLWLCSLLSVGALVLQLSVPIALLDLRLSWLFFVLSFGFHAGVLVATNISFLPYWVPAVLIFLFPHGASPYDGPIESARYAISGAWDASPIGFSCACMYLFVQAIVSTFLVDLVHGDILPLSCEPMFVLPRSLHDQWPKIMVLTSADCRECGHLEPYLHYTFNPCSKVFPMDEDSMMRLPSHTLIFVAHDAHIPPECKKIVIDDPPTTTYMLWSNVQIDDDTLQMYSEIADILNDHEHPACKDLEKLDRLVYLQRQCAAAFKRSCMLPPKSFGFSSSKEPLADACKPLIISPK